MKRVYWGIWFHGDPGAQNKYNHPGLCSDSGNDNNVALFASRADAEIGISDWCGLSGPQNKFSLARVTVEVEPRKGKRS